MRSPTGRRAPVSLLALIVAAGCSGSGDDGGAQPDAQPTFAELQAEAVALEDRTAQLGLTDPGTLPVSGSASFDGVIGLGSDGANGAPGDFGGTIALAVDFGSDELAGEATDFVTAGEDRIDGTLAITASAIDRASDPSVEPTYSFDMAGTLVEEDGDAFDVDMVGDGAFLGSDGEATFGFVDGVIVNDQGVGTDVGGAYIAD